MHSSKVHLAMSMCGCPRAPLCRVVVHTCLKTHDTI